MNGNAVAESHLTIAEFLKNTGSEISIQIHDQGRPRLIRNKQFAFPMDGWDPWRVRWLCALFDEAVFRDDSLNIGHRAAKVRNFDEIDATVLHCEPNVNPGSFDVGQDVGTSLSRYDGIFASLRLPRKNTRLLNHYQRLSLYGLEGFNRHTDADDADDGQDDICQSFRQKQMVEVIVRFSGGLILITVGCLLLYYADGPRRRVRRFDVLGILCLSVGFGAITLSFYWGGDCQQNNENNPHGSITVPQEYGLTSPSYRDTAIATGDTPMANGPSAEKQTAIIGARAERSSIRPTERQTGVHRDTIMRLDVRVGKVCLAPRRQDGRSFLPTHQLDEIGVGRQEGKACAVGPKIALRLAMCGRGLRLALIRSLFLLSKSAGAIVRPRVPLEFRNRESEAEA